MAGCLSTSKHWANTLFYRNHGLTCGFDISTEVGLFPPGQSALLCFLITSLPGIGGIAQMGADLNMCKIEKFAPFKAKTDGEGRSFYTEINGLAAFLETVFLLNALILAQHVTTLAKPSNH